MKQVQTGQPLYSKTGQVYLLLTSLASPWFLLLANLLCGIETVFFNDLKITYLS